MEDLTALIVKLNQPTETIGYGVKCRTVRLLADALPNREVIDAYLGLLRRVDEDFSVKSEILNALSWCDFENASEVEAVQHVVTELIRQDEDSVVTTAAIGAAQQFVNSPQILNVLVDYLLEPTRAHNPRAAAFTAICSQPNKDLAKSCLQRLLSDAEFGESARVSLASI